LGAAEVAAETAQNLSDEDGVWRAIWDKVGCFTPGTTVHTVEGAVAIEEVAPGSRVVTRVVDEASPARSGVAQRTVASAVWSWLLRQARTQPWSPMMVGAVSAHEPSTGTWVEQVEVPTGGTYVWNGWVVRDGVGVLGRTDGTLALADDMWTAGAAAVPEDVGAWVLSLDDEPAPTPLFALPEGSRFAYDGWVYEVTEVTSGGVAYTGTGEALGRVEAASTREVSGIYELDVSVGGEVATLEVTADHPFWSPTQRAFVRVMNLEVGARLETRSGGTAIVVGKTWRPGAVTVHNLEVAGLHHYVVHVGDDDAVVVHNGLCPRATAEALSRLKGVPWGQYRETGCEAVARKIHKTIGGEIKTIKPSDPGARTLGGRARIRDTGWVFHQVVVKDGMVYDALTGRGGLTI